jgi:hypothetical protein
MLYREIYGCMDLDIRSSCKRVYHILCSGMWRHVVTYARLDALRLVALRLVAPL